MLPWLPTGALETRGYKGAMIVTLVFFTILSWISQVQPLPASLATWPDFGTSFTQYVKFNHTYITTSTIGDVVAIFGICLIDISSILHACAKEAGLISSENNTIPRQYWVYVSCAVGSILAACFGIQSIYASMFCCLVCFDCLSAFIS